jgi:gas vesicle protein
MSHRTRNRFLSGMLIGGFLGSIAGIMLAPYSGQRTREMMRHRGTEAASRALSVTGETREAAERAWERARSEAHGAINALRRVLLSKRGRTLNELETEDLMDAVDDAVEKLDGLERSFRDEP